MRRRRVLAVRLRRGAARPGRPRRRSARDRVLRPAALGRIHAGRGARLRHTRRPRRQRLGREGSDREHAALTESHDIVAVATRGTGASGAIDCADIQSGFSSLRELRNDTAACGAQLGDDADRYGGGDVAMDIDTVREALGFETIDYYGFSYATVDAQAYAARFPERLHAVVLDSGLPVSDDGLAFFWGLGVPETLVRVPALYCEQDLACSADVPERRGRPASADRGRRSASARGPGRRRDRYPRGSRGRPDRGRVPLGLDPLGSLADRPPRGGVPALEDGNAAPLMRLATAVPAVHPRRGRPPDRLLERR